MAPDESRREVKRPESPRTEKLESELSQALRPVRVAPRWLGWLLICAGVLMLPWVAGLAYLLPVRHETAHYNIAWVGFDLVLCAFLVRVGWLAQRGREHIELSAAMTGTLLLVDAWFDVMTADSSREFTLALVLALVGELPLAGICLYVAGRAEFRRQERARTMAVVANRLKQRRAG